MPACGKSDTLGGEVVRAVGRIEYRWWNDGDKAFEGYGRETVNPAVRFLAAKVEKCEFGDAIEALQYPCSNKKYDENIKTLTKTALDWVREHKAWEIPNDEDMLEYRTEEDVDNDPYDEDEDDYDWGGYDDDQYEDEDEE